MTSDTRSKIPQTFNPSNLPTPPPTYNQVSVVPILPSSKLVTLAGQCGISPDTGDVPTDFVSQVKLAYVSVLNGLRAAGAAPRDIIHVRHYIVHNTGDNDLDSKELIDRGWGALWMEFMDRDADGHRPPDTVLGVASLAKEELAL